MAVSKMICPDCEAVLRPAKPVPEGKSVKCPKCGATFTAIAFDDEDEPAPPASKKAANPQPSPIKKKPEPSKPEPAKPAAKPQADDDEEGGTYGVIKEKEDEEEQEQEEEEEEEEYDDEDDDEDEGRSRRGKARSKKKKKKPEIDYAPDLSVKDPRGPAQEAIVSPSNLLMITGLVGFIGWLAFLVMILIPALFPLEDEDKIEKDRPKQALVIPQRGGVSSLTDAGGANEKVSEKERREEKGPQPSFITVAGYDFGLLANYDWPMFILCLLPILFGMAYCFTVAVGAAKIQNLDSREWGIVSSIMAMLPYNVAGVILVTLIASEQLILANLFDSADTIFLIEVIWAVLLCLVGAGAGLWALLVLMREDIKEGFEYKPE
jgi:hypothetical protein